LLRLIEAARCRRESAINYFAVAFDWRDRFTRSKSVWRALSWTMLGVAPIFFATVSIEHEPLPDFGRIAFKRQGEAALWLAGHRVDMMAARADIAKTIAVDTAVTKG
jgi:hypothetical protein